MIAILGKPLTIYFYGFLLFLLVPGEQMEGLSLGGGGEDSSESSPKIMSGKEEAAPPLHIDFSLTSREFEALLSPCPPFVRETAGKNPQQFLELAAGMLSMPEELLVLVDKTHPLPEGYAPGELTALDQVEGLALSRPGHRFDSRGVEALQELSAAARKDEVVLLISSTYRSFEYQKNLFENYAARDGIEEAQRYSAFPGTSQHQLGTAVDLGSITDAFGASKAGLWIAGNGGKYGFSLSYPQGEETLTGYRGESWHWRWIGREAAAMQKQFFGDKQQLLLEFWDRASPALRASYKKSF